MYKPASRESYDRLKLVAWQRTLENMLTNFTSLHPPTEVGYEDTCSLFRELIACHQRRIFMYDELHDLNYE